MSTTPAAPGAVDDDGQAAFEAEFHDGPPVMGVAIVLAVFMAGMALGGYLTWLRVFGGAL